MRPRRSSQTSSSGVVEHLADRAGHECADADTFGRGTPADALDDARVGDGGQGFPGRGGIRQGAEYVAEHARLLLHERRGGGRQIEPCDPRLSRHQRDILRDRATPCALFQIGGDPGADGVER